MIVPAMKLSKTKNHEIPEWLAMMVTTREICRQTMGSQYDIAIAPYKQEISDIMDDTKKSPLAALKDIMAALDEMSPGEDDQQIKVMCHSLAMCAALDMSEAEEKLT